MKIYVAGAIIDKERMSILMDTLEKLGHDITWRWPNVVQSGSMAAINDIRGVGQADLLLAVLERDDYQYWGTRHEIGAAYLKREQTNGETKIWIVCNGGDPRDKSRLEIPVCMQTCFELAADRYFETIEEAVKALS